MHILLVAVDMEAEATAVAATAEEDTHWVEVTSAEITRAVGTSVEVMSVAKAILLVVILDL